MHPDWSAEETAGLTWVEVDTDLRLAVRRWGPSEAPTVLLLPGGGQTWRSWAATGQRLVRDGFQVLLMDFRGHGDSDWSVVGDYTTDTLVSDVRAVIAGLATPPVLVGASMGAMLGLLAEGESRGGLLSGLVVVDYAPSRSSAGLGKILDFMSGQDDGFASVEEAAQRLGLFRGSRPPGDLSGLRAQLRSGTDGRLRWHWDPKFMTGKGVDSMATPDRARAAARGVKCPVLVVRGAISDVVSDSAAAELADLCGGRWLAVPRGSHKLVGEDNDVFGSAVLDFLHTDVAQAAR
ncbi:alpha/beta fold hydrolase [[Mycobacterium] vasticus]|uniref:Alpha/beta hydrolase n=1 Tax=[Mycobacterium] vasticus TaxID=2875777 RepID=A0ABU5YYR9_9MYCO|nr:alpha/beta hydrolase [Mycolicibacter sp. MYC017]MEB3070286.1 alpha/beta hydrolase [Mycolicibacter sp. MYC017]